MFAEDRRKEIVNKVKREGSVKVDILAKQFQVTEDCIRKDLTILEKDGLLKKVYGGAVDIRNHPQIYSSKDREKQPSSERLQIAKQAYALLKEKQRVYLDVSVTSVEIAKLLAEKPMHITVMTNMIEVLLILHPITEIGLVFLGGTINQERDGFWSANTIEQLKHYKIDLAFLGVVGINQRTNELTTYQEDDAMLKHTVIEQSKNTYILSEKEKYNADGDYVYAYIDEISGFITSGDNNVSE